MSPYEPLYSTQPPLPPRPALTLEYLVSAADTKPHDTRRYYVTATLQELRAKLAARRLSQYGVLEEVDDYIRQIEEFLEATAPEGT